MMLVLLVSLLVAANAEPTYSRAYLNGMKATADEQRMKKWIADGTTFIENEVLVTATKGLTQYTTYAFTGCAGLVHNRNGLEEKILCENIVSGIRTNIAKRFPDSEIIFDAQMQRWTMIWGP